MKPWIMAQVLNQLDMINHLINGTLRIKCKIASDIYCWGFNWTSQIINWWGSSNGQVKNTVHGCTFLVEMWWKKTNHLHRLKTTSNAQHFHRHCNIVEEMDVVGQGVRRQSIQSRSNQEIWAQTWPQRIESGRTAIDCHNRSMGPALTFNSETG